MFGTVSTVFRGFFPPALPALAAGGAMVEFDERIDSAKEDLAAARRAFAGAIAEDGALGQQIETLAGEIEDGMIGALAALRSGREDRAAALAGRLADLGFRRHRLEETRARLAQRLRGLREDVADASVALTDLQRERRIAHLREDLARRAGLRCRRRTAPGEAERELERLEDRQREAEAAAKARRIVRAAAAAPPRVALAPAPDAAAILAALRAQAGAENSGGLDFAPDLPSLS